MNTILHSNINLFEEIMKPNSQIKPPSFSFFMVQQCSYAILFDECFADIQIFYLKSPLYH